MEIASALPKYHGKFKGQGMVTLSFDDGREDFYRVAYPIMKKYGLLGTFHIVTGWVEGRWAPPVGGTGWYSTVGGPMTVAQIQECHRYGIEMSAHGDMHDNTEQNIYDCVNKLKEWGVTRNGLVEGFASPGSGLTPELRPTMEPWFKNAGLTHARSGTVVGATSGKDVANNMNYPPPYDYRLTSIVVTDNNTVAELLPAINDAINNNNWCVLMLHSILHPTDPGYNKGDNWWWDVSKFEQLCQWLASVPDEKLLKVTMRDGFQYAKGNYPIIESLVNKQKSSRRARSSDTETDISNGITFTKIDNSI